MTLALVELGLSGILLWCAIRCVQFWPALAGNERKGTHCTGSLIVLLTGVLGYGLSGFLKRLLEGLGIGAAAGAAARGGGKAAPGEAPAEPAPAEPAPSEPLPLLPEALSYSSNTQGVSTASLTGRNYSAGQTPASALAGQALAFRMI